MYAVTPMPTPGGGGAGGGSESDPPAPPHQSHHHEESITVVSVCDYDPPSIPVAVQEPLPKAAPTSSDHREEFAADRELRGWLMVLATLIASITYTSGLAPPSRFDFKILHAGNHIMRCKYKIFYYANTAAFALSLFLILLLASRDLRELAKTKALEVLVALDMIALLVAYAVSSPFDLNDLMVCIGLVLVVPVALVVISARLYGKYFWDEV